MENKSDDPVVSVCSLEVEESHSSSDVGGDFNPDTTMGNQKDSKCTGRKSQVNEHLWKVNKRKYLRNSGMAYGDRKGKLHAAKEFKPRPMGLVCKGRMCHQISEDACRYIFQNFWKLSDYNAQNAYIRDCIALKSVSRRRVPEKQIKHSRRQDSTKSISRFYHFEYDDVKYDICKTCFLRILQISSCRVNVVCQKPATDAVSVCDKRGRKQNLRKTSDENLEYVRDHLKSMLQYISLYSSNDQESDSHVLSVLTVGKIYKLYVEKCCKANKQPVSFGVFKGVEQEEFNISRHPLTLKEACKQCDIWETKVNVARKSNNISVERVLSIGHELHSRRGKLMKKNFQKNETLLENEPYLCVNLK